MDESQLQSLCFQVDGAMNTNGVHGRTSGGCLGYNKATGVAFVRLEWQGDVPTIEQAWTFPALVPNSRISVRDGTTTIDVAMGHILGVFR